MNVTIWDLDYFYAENKTNCFNSDVMKISSYHKQLGDTINFVLKKDDIRRPYDIYYIIKEKNSTPNPPGDFLLNSKIKWWGNAYKARINWKMSDAMLGCRPDYLLYPEYNTQLERAEHIRFFNNQGELLPIYQNYENSFKKKKIIVSDRYMWCANKNSIIIALDRILNVKNVYFLHEINVKRIIYDKDIKNKFLELKLSPGANLKWSTIRQEDFDKTLEFLLELKKQNPSVNVGTIKVKYSDSGFKHWDNRDCAIKDFIKLKNLIIKGKRNKISIEVIAPQYILETPYSYFFSVLCEWTEGIWYKKSWLEFLTKKYAKIGAGVNSVIYWSSPERWSEIFRDLLRQSYTDKEFLLLEWGENNLLSSQDIPWKIWEEEFKYGI